MKMIKITLSLFAVMALTLTAPIASAHCGSCGSGDKKHEHKEGAKCCGKEGKCCKENKDGDKKACPASCEKECCKGKEKEGEKKACPAGCEKECCKDKKKDA